MLAIEKLSPSKPGIYSPNEMAESGSNIYLTSSMSSAKKSISYKHNS